MVAHPGADTEGMASMQAQRTCACGCGELTAGGTYKRGHVARVLRGPALERFLAKVDKAGPLMPGMDTPCWQWTGSERKRGEGYGQFKVDGKQHAAYRWSYEHFVGPIPDGLHIDHLCRNHGCVRPEHLEPVTCRENLHRGQTNAAKTHCKRGHPLTPDNVYVYRGGRTCLECRRARGREFDKRRRPRKRKKE